MKISKGMIVASILQIICLALSYKLGGYVGLALMALICAMETRTHLSERD